MLAADGAARVALDPHLVELARERVVDQQPPDQRLADPERELQRLVRLQRADDTRQHAEDAALGARRRELGRRGSGEEAAVARSVADLEHADLPLEAVDRAVDDRDTA